MKELPAHRLGRAFRMAALAAVPALALLAGPARAEAIRELRSGTYWGESSPDLLAHFDGRATELPWPIDFGDSYANVVLRNFPVGGYPLVVFFQMDKTTHGLKRIQLERQRHGVNPPAFRGVVGDLETEFGTPETLCEIPPVAASGYQAAVEGVWQSDGAAIRAIFRDTTIEASEGCLFGDPAFFGPCGLTGQLLVRISPPGADNSVCTTAARSPPAAAR